MITNPVYGDANPVTCVPGYERLVVATVNSPITNVVMVVVNGVSYVSGTNLTLTARGTVCWTGVINLSAAGLTPNKRYTWTVTQAANSDAGSYYHTPKKGTNFKLLFAGCDNNTNFSNASGAFQQTVAGFWEHYKKLYDLVANTAADIAGILFPDDLGYIGALIVDDSATSAYGNNTGLKMSVVAGNVAATQDDYYVGWCALWGMLGPRGTFTTDASARYTDNAWLQLMWARETNRSFCRKNFDVFPGCGDWEWRQDFAWDNSPTKGAYLGKYTIGKTAWDAFYGLCQPPNNVITPLDTTANHWVNKLGDLTIACPDGITNVTRADWTAGTGNELAMPNGPSIGDNTTAPTQFQTIYGANQITDIKKAVSVLSSPFCIFGMGLGARYVTNRSAVSGIYSTITTAVGEYNYSGMQHPIFDHCLDEWQSLVTNMADGLMSNTHFNGTHGCGMFFHSDWHHRAWYQNVHPAYTGNLAENFPSIFHGTTNGSTNFNLPNVSAIGAIAGMSTEIKYIDLVTDFEDHNFGGLIAEVFGANSPKKMVVSLYDGNNNVVHSETFSPKYVFGGMAAKSSLFK